MLQNILGPLEGDGQVAVLLFHLVVAVIGGGVVRHSGGLEDKVSLLLPGGHCLKHILSRDDGDYLHKGRGRQSGGAGDEGDLGPPEHGHPGDGIAHFSGGVVGEVAHRIQRLLGGAGGDQHPPALLVGGVGKPAQNLLE